PLDAIAARPPLVPQGSLSLPLLRGSRRHRHPSRLAQPYPSDRPPPSRPPSLDVALLANERPRPAPLFIRCPRRDGPRPASLLAVVPGLGTEVVARTLAAPLRVAALAALPAAQRAAAFNDRGAGFQPAIFPQAGWKPAPRELTWSALIFAS